MGKASQQTFFLVILIILISWQSVESGSVYVDSVTGMEFVFVKGGCFIMGDIFGDGERYERPVHEVCINDFYIGKYEVTQAQWQNLLGNNPSFFSYCGDNCPVEQVSWNEVQNYIRILNKKSGKKYRLPTEAEWEYAARSGGKKEKYAGTNNEREIGEYAWFQENSGGRSHTVGQKKPNGLGLYDMSGNVFEWMQDNYSDTAYSYHRRNNPLYIEPKNGDRVIRGGCWNELKAGRASARFPRDQDGGSDTTGFRLVKTN